MCWRFWGGAGELTVWMLRVGGVGVCLQRRLGMWFFLDWGEQNLWSSPQRAVRKAGRDKQRAAEVTVKRRSLWLGSVELILVLFPETVTSREELPAALLVHLPYVRLLACVLCFIFVDEIHHKE